MLKQSLGRVAASIAPALILALAMPSVGHSQQGTLVVTDQVSEVEFHDQVALVGRTEARIQSKIVAEIDGRVIAINAPEGSAIRKGQALVTIDTSRLVLSLRAKEAEARQAEQQAFLASQNLKRANELFEQKLVPESTIDSARAWAISTEAQHALLQAERDRLRLDVDRCVIRAPYTGYTLRRSVDVGEWVSPGTAVYNMVDLSTITVQVDLPERYFGQVDVGSPVDVLVSGDSSQMFIGEVTGIARSASSETHTFPVLIRVANSDGRLGGGKLVKARLNLRSKFTSLAVHKDAIVRNGLQTLVYTIADGKAVPVPVEVRSTSKELAAVTGEQLAVGMVVVVRGNERIYPGAPVRIDESDDDSDAQQSAMTQPASSSTN